jgi:hypothetical protein
MFYLTPDIILIVRVSHAESAFTGTDIINQPGCSASGLKRIQDTHSPQGIRSNRQAW